MSVHVELILRIRDDADEHPHVETTACTTEDEMPIEGLVTAFSDVLLRCGFAHGQVLQIAAEVVDLTFPEDGLTEDLGRAEQTFRDAAAFLVNAWREYREAKASKDDDD